MIIPSASNTIRTILTIFICATSSSNPLLVFSCRAKATEMVNLDLKLEDRMRLQKYKFFFVISKGNALQSELTRQF